MNAARIIAMRTLYMRAPLVVVTRNGTDEVGNGDSVPPLVAEPLAPSFTPIGEGWVCSPGRRAWQARWVWDFMKVSATEKVTKASMFAIIKSGVTSVKPPAKDDVLFLS